MLRQHRLRAIVSVACLAAVVLSSCGGGSSSSTQASTKLASTALPKKENATLILDFIPNAVHAGIYRAIAAGYYKEQNINLKVIQPTSTADTLKLIDAGKATIGLADGIDVASQIDLGRDAKAIMAVVQRPLGGPITLASEHITSPAELQGKTVGITGVPSDLATLDTTVTHAGGNPKKVHVVTIGFNGVQDLEAKRVAAFTGFWPADGVQLEVNGYPIKAFKLDENGGPAYPGLVAFSTEGLIKSNPALLRAWVAATVHGYQDTIKDPKRSLEDLLELNPTLEPKFTEASLKAYLPLFTDSGAIPYGQLQEDKVKELSEWLLKYKLIHAPISPQRYGTNEFLPEGK
jgi:putative hydroxymethylpyrimidine transport system substrate-binding protein